MRCCHAARARLFLSAGPVRPLRLPLLFHHTQDPGRNSDDYSQDPEDDSGGHNGRKVGSLQPEKCPFLMQWMLLDVTEWQLEFKIKELYLSHAHDGYQTMKVYHSHWQAQLCFYLQVLWNSLLRMK